MASHCLPGPSSHKKRRLSDGALKDAISRKKSSSFESKVHTEQAFVKLDRMCKQREFCDVILVVNDIKIPAHKIVLAACSDYFHKMFLENEYEQMHSVEIEGVDGEVLSLLVNYCYTCKISITEENIEKLLVAAKLLVLSEVQTACCNFLKEKLRPSNCLRMLHIAENSKYQELKSHIDTYIANKFLEVVQHDEFLGLNYKQISMLLSRNDLNTHTQEEVFESILVWVRHDSEERKQHLSSLTIEHINFLLLSTGYLMEKLDEPLLEKDTSFKMKVLEAMKERTPKGSSTKLNTKLRQAPLPSEVLLAIGTYKGKIHMGIYDFNEGTWTEERSINRDWVYGSAAIVCGKKVYVIGGNYNNVDVFDLFTKKWASCDKMLHSGLNMGITSLDYNIYAVGGRVESNFVSTAQLYDTRTDRWKAIAPMGMKRADLSLGTVDGNLYAVGGKIGQNVRSTVECYDPERNTWSHLADMHFPRRRPGVAALDGILYVVGGSDRQSLKSAEAFNPSTSRWTRIADMQVARFSPGIVAKDGLIYVVGGWNHDPLNSVEVYDPKANTWTLLPREMRTAKANAFATVANWVKNS